MGEFFGVFSLERFWTHQKFLKYFKHSKLKVLVRRLMLNNSGIKNMLCERFTLETSKHYYCIMIFTVFHAAVTYKNLCNVNDLEYTQLDLSLIICFFPPLTCPHWRKMLLIRNFPQVKTGQNCHGK